MRKNIYKYIRLDKKDEKEFVLQKRKFEMIHDPSDKSDTRDREEIVNSKEDQIVFLEKSLGTDLNAEFRQDVRNRLWLIRDLYPGLGDEHIPTITIVPKVRKKERV